MRDEKQLLLDEIKEHIDGSKGFLVARYQGMDAQKVRHFRDILAKAQGDFEIVRKRVFGKAAQASGISVDVDEFQGHIGVIFAKGDPVELAKVAVKYGEDNEQAIKIVGGHLDGAICSGSDIEAIAKLPSLPVLRAEFLGLLEAPMAQTVAVLQTALTDVLSCMEEKAKKG